MHDDFTREIMKRRTFLNEVITRKEKDISQAPNGILRVNRRKNKTQYYYRTDKTDVNGTYIRKNQFELAQSLAQKGYDEKLLATAQKEFDLLTQIIKKYSRLESPENVYDSLSDELKNLVHPINPPAEWYVYRWKKATKDVPRAVVDRRDYISDREEYMRSKSELLIANELNKNNIPYIYEKKITFKDAKYAFPDFTLFDRKTMREIYWEHLGRMDDLEYVNNNLSKLNRYIDNDIYPGVNLILTFESYKVQLNTGVLRKTIQNLKQRYEIALSPGIVW